MNGIYTCILIPNVTSPILTTSAAMELFNLFKDLFMTLTSIEYLHCLLGSNCDHIIFVLGSSSCILPKKVLMLCIKLFNGVLPTSLAPQCKMRYCCLSLTFSNVLIFLYISNHIIPPFPCHQIFIPTFVVLNTLHQVYFWLQQMLFSLLKSQQPRHETLQHEII